MFAYDVVRDAGGGNIATMNVFPDMSPDRDGYLRLHFFPTYFKETAFVNAIEVVPGLPGRMLPVRISASRQGFTDSAGVQWSADRFYSGGQQIQRFGQPYPGERFGNFTYQIPVATDRTYTVTLKFCENWFGEGRTGGEGPGARIFDVYVNGRTLLKNFDVLKEAGGPLRPVDKTFRGVEPTPQGKLFFQFVPARNYAMINAIEVVDEGR
jgi:hypothetical protein